MAGRYKAYPDYNDAKVEWLGSIPKQWGALNGKRLFKNRRELALTSDEQLAASQKYGVVPQSLMIKLNDAKVMLALKGTSTFRHVEKDDFVISLRSFEGGIEHSAYVGCVSPAYTVLKAVKDVEPSYYKLLFKSQPFISALQSTTDSLRDGKSITYEQFGAIPLAVPPLPEQKQIARFLDHETGKIDRLIAKQQALIALLKEKRQAVISHAVTKGLNPQAKMKDSGVEWLGQVPEHWEVVSFAQCVSITGGLVDPRVKPFKAYAMIAPNHIESKSGRLLALETAAEQGAESGKYLCKDGEVIYSKIRPALAKACLCPRDNVLCSADMYPMRGALGLSNSYLFRLVLTDEFTAFTIMESDRVAMPKMNRETLGSTRLPIPPESEQSDIVRHIETECTKIDKLISHAETAAKLLQERRTALISAAVTGKIDVRDWEPSAPEESEVPR